ncbi:MAG: hypothetical protein ACREQ7_24585 [Candidatus Binatia bacterium]
MRIRLEEFAGQLRGCRNVVFFTRRRQSINGDPTPLDDLADFGVRSMISMRPMLLICFATTLAGCVNRRAVWVNDQGHRLTCEVSGYGLAGGILADSKYDACVSDARMRGYRLEEQKN